MKEIAIRIRKGTLVLLVVLLTVGILAIPPFAIILYEEMHVRPFKQQEHKFDSLVRDHRVIQVQRLHLLQGYEELAMLQPIEALESWEAAASAGIEEEDIVTALSLLFRLANENQHIRHQIQAAEPLPSFLPRNLEQALYPLVASEYEDGTPIDWPALRPLVIDMVPSEWADRRQNFELMLDAWSYASQRGADRLLNVIQGSVLADDTDEAVSALSIYFLGARRADKLHELRKAVVAASQNPRSSNIFNVLTSEWVLACDTMSVEERARLLAEMRRSAMDIDALYRYMRRLPRLERYADMLRQTYRALEPVAVHPEV